MKEKSILDKPLFDIALDVAGWGIKTIFKGAKAGVTAIADNLPTEANKERKREEERQKVLDGLEAARRSVIDAMVADRRDRDTPLEEPIEETCFNLLYDQMELLAIANEIAKIDPNYVLLGKPVSEVNYYDDLPIKTYKEFFEYKDTGTKVLKTLRQAESTKRWLKEDYEELMMKLEYIPNFLAKDPYKVNYKRCLEANKLISDFLEEHPILDDERANSLKELIDFTNKVYELNKYKIEHEEKEEARKRAEADRKKAEEERKKAEAAARERAELEQETLEDLRDSIEKMNIQMSEGYNPFR